MGEPLDDLEPGCLYITIAIPTLGVSESLPFELYPNCVDNDFDPTNYEISVGLGGVREEFDWGLYWLHSEAQGTWYTLRQEADPNEYLYFGSMSPHVLHKHAVTPSNIRFNRGIVGLVRVVRLPTSLCADMPTYLDWLTAQAAPIATRTFIWAATAYIRCRRHIENIYDDGEDSYDHEHLRAFDVNSFLRETLDFAYREVWHGLIGGKVPRPVMVSEHGVELQMIEEEEEERNREVMSEMMGASDEIEVQVARDSEWPALPSQAAVSDEDKRVGSKH